MSYYHSQWSGFDPLSVLQKSLSNIHPISERDAQQCLRGYALLGMKGNSLILRGGVCISFGPPDFEMRNFQARVIETSRQKEIPQAGARVELPQEELQEEQFVPANAKKQVVVPNLLAAQYQKGATNERQHGESGGPEETGRPAENEDDAGIREWQPNNGETAGLCAEGYQP